MKETKVKPTTTAATVRKPIRIQAKKRKPDEAPRRFVTVRYYRRRHEMEFDTEEQLTKWMEAHSLVNGEKTFVMVYERMGIAPKARLQVKKMFETGAGVLPIEVRRCKRAKVND